jgi:putative thioredoxin
MPEEVYAYAGTAENFDTLVLENSRKGPVLVDFWAPWAGPSLRQGELLLVWPGTTAGASCW